MGNTLKTSGNSKFTIKSMLFVILVVGGVTGINIWWNPQKENLVGTSEYERFYEYDFSFSHLKGMNFTAVGTEGENATDKEGCLFGVIETEDHFSEAIKIIWNRTIQEPSLNETLDSFFVNNLDNATNHSDYYVNSSGEDHKLLYAFYNISDPQYGKMEGIVGVLYCNVTKRVFTVQLISKEAFTNLEEFQTRYQELMDSFRCHPQARGKELRFWIFSENDLARVSAIVFLCVGFTFTYMMDGFLNLAQTSYAGIGSIISVYLVRYAGFNSYDTWPIAGLIGGLIGMILYLGIVRPISKHASSWKKGIILTFTFWVVALLLGTITNILSYWNRIIMIDYESEFNPVRYSFSWFGLSGNVFLGLFYCFIFILSLYMFLTNTKPGMSLRATAEDEKLAMVLGINPFRAHLLSWFISGAISAIAGSIYRVASGSDEFLIQVMTGSIVGGLDNIYGAVYGGILITIAQKIFVHLLFLLFGVDLFYWISMVPLFFLWTVLFIAPDGLTNLKGRIFDKIHEVSFKLSKSRTRK